MILLFQPYYACSVLNNRVAWTNHPWVHNVPNYGCLDRSPINARSLDPNGTQYSNTVILASRAISSSFSQSKQFKAKCTGLFDRKEIENVLQCAAPSCLNSLTVDWRHSACPRTLAYPYSCSVTRLFMIDGHVLLAKGCTRGFVVWLLDLSDVSSVFVIDCLF